MSQYDNFYGRIFAATGQATDGYTESLVTMPVPVAASGKNYWVPVIKQVSFEFTAAANLMLIAADATLRGFLCVGDISQWSALPTYSLGDPNVIAGAILVNALTTSGQSTFRPDIDVILPGDGLIVLEPYCTLMTHNSGTGQSLGLNARIWYEYTLMDEMTYMRALHGINF